MRSVPSDFLPCYITHGDPVSACVTIAVRIAINTWTKIDSISYSSSQREPLTSSRDQQRSLDISTARSMDEYVDLDTFSN